MMANLKKQSFQEELCLEEICEITMLSTDIIVEIVEHGIVEPSGEAPEKWRFSPNMLNKTQKAVRLHKDLDIDWPGIALALNLIDEIQDLKETNYALTRRLNRFYQW